jgi:hypothetical protein
MKKRKIEMEKKQEIKKPSSSVLIGKAHLKSVLKSSSSTNPSHVYGSSSQPDPSALVQSQTAARVKVQIDAPKPVKHAILCETRRVVKINPKGCNGINLTESIVFRDCGIYHFLHHKKISTD